MLCGGVKVADVATGMARAAKRSQADRFESLDTSFFDRVYQGLLHQFNHAPKRDRKLLLHKREIEKLDEATSRQGYTALPLDVYLKGGRIKVLVGVCKGKRQYDKREDAKRRDAQREVDAAIKKGRGR